MSAKKLINSPKTVVSDAIEGMLLMNPNISRVGDLHVLVRSDIITYRQQHVTCISGGGSGHEPSHAGFIGDGMLSGACLGNVFASPSVSQILAAIRTCAGPLGVLLIVKNYTGDRLNFGMAMELARQEGILCKMVIVADDCALPLGKGITGGRGVAGTLFVHKIAGAAAKKGMNLDNVYHYATWASKNVGSMGIALSVCTVPGTLTSQRLQDPNIYELGMGIHGESGREQKLLPSANAAIVIAKELVDAIIGSIDRVLTSRINIQTGSNVALLVNNLGSLPAIEMLIMTKEVTQYLTSRGVVVSRIFNGSYMTALEMSGVSVSLLILPDDDTNIIDLLDDPTTVSYWIHSLKINVNSQSNHIPYNEREFEKKIFGGPLCHNPIPIIHRVARRIVEIEPLLTEFDSICGDGDCGLVMKAGAEKLLLDFQENENNSYDSALLCDSIANCISSSMGGTSGVLLELFFRAVATSLSTITHESKCYWAKPLLAGLEAMKTYGGASVGMRTMLDSLEPAILIIQQDDFDSNQVIEAARVGMEATKVMESLAGRSNYVGLDKMRGIPDPGAVFIYETFKTIFQSI